jgi:hypothetical protein
MPDVELLSLLSDVIFLRNIEFITVRMHTSLSEFLSLLLSDVCRSVSDFIPAIMFIESLLRN